MSGPSVIGLESVAQRDRFLSVIPEFATASPEEFVAEITVKL